MGRSNKVIPSLPLPPQPDSLDPADWWMYCDLLQDAGARPALWRRAKRVGDSLKREPRLLLLGGTIPAMFSRDRKRPSVLCLPNESDMRDGTIAFPVWVRVDELGKLAAIRPIEPDPIGGRHPGQPLRANEFYEWFDAACMETFLTTYRDIIINDSLGAFWSWSIGRIGDWDLKRSFFNCHGRVDPDGRIAHRIEV